MIAVFVEFDAGEPLDGALVRKVADGSRGLFEGMPGLHWKFFTLDEDRRLARNVYVWRNDDAARQFFSEEMIGQIADAYGVRPTVRYTEIIGVVDNAD